MSVKCCKYEAGCIGFVTVPRYSHQDSICKFLKEHHRGKDRAVHSKELERLFSLSDRSVRRRINALRQDGYPICSDETGYYYAELEEEIIRTINRLAEFVAGIGVVENEMLTMVNPTVPVRINVSL